MIYDRILSMAICHLTNNGSKLVKLSPELFGSFSVKMASVWSIRAGETVHAVIFVILNMKGGNEPCEVFSEVRKVTEVATRKDALEKLDGILTSTIVRDKVW